MYMRSLRYGLKFYAHALKSGLTPTVFSSNNLIHQLTQGGFIQDAHKLFDEMPDRNVFTWNAIINAYIKTRNLSQARRLFAEAPYKDSVTFNLMLSGYVDTDGCENEAVKLFLELQCEKCQARIDEFSLIRMLNLTATRGVLISGRQLHCYMLKTGNDLSRFATSSLIDMYSKCGGLLEAWRVFDRCEKGISDLVSKNAMVAACCRGGELEFASNLFWSQPELYDQVTWNTMISGYAQNGYKEAAIKLFKLMAKERVQGNEHTFASILTACSGLKNIEMGKQVHARVLKEGMIKNPFIISGIVDVYCKCGDMKRAELVSASIGVENTYVVASMIVGYSAVQNMVEARRLFDLLAEKGSVVWTAIMSGYVKSQQCETVFELFREFAQYSAIEPDALILLSLLSACVLRANIDPGKQIHAYLLRVGYNIDEKMVSAMVDMYAKCGNINYARRIFHQVIGKDCVLYNIMISGCAHHGCEYEALQLFEEMKDKGIQPDSITFIAILSACRHRGLVGVGEHYFSLMTEECAIPPETDHYACMIDLYGRANQLEKAVEFMGKIPIELDAVIIGTFINACKSNKNVELARAMEDKLLKIGGDNGSRYVQLASIYAVEGKWDEMGRVLKQMRGNEVKKLAGCSWVHIGERIHTFTSGDRSHSETHAIYSIVGCLIQELNGLHERNMRTLEE